MYGDFLFAFKEPLLLSVGDWDNLTVLDDTKPVVFGKSLFCCLLMPYSFLLTVAASLPENC